MALRWRWRNANIFGMTNFVEYRFNVLPQKNKALVLCSSCTSLHFIAQSKCIELSASGQQISFTFSSMLANNRISDRFEKITVILITFNKEYINMNKSVEIAFFLCCCCWLRSGLHICYQFNLNRCASPSLVSSIGCHAMTQSAWMCFFVHFFFWVGKIFAARKMRKTLTNIISYHITGVVRSFLLTCMIAS